MFRTELAGSHAELNPFYHRNEYVGCEQWSRFITGSEYAYHRELHRLHVSFAKVWDRNLLSQGFAQAFDRQRKQAAYRNASGAHIYLRPAGESAYTLLDDLTSTTLADMRDQRFAPAAVIETSPGNFQAWLHHPRPLPKELGTLAAKMLAERFNADPSAAYWRRFGRAPGFTNRKPQHRVRDGVFPFATWSALRVKCLLQPAHSPRSSWSGAGKCNDNGSFFNMNDVHLIGEVQPKHLRLFASVQRHVMWVVPPQPTWRSAFVHTGTDGVRTRSQPRCAPTICPAVPI